MQTFRDVYRHRFILSNLVSKNFKALYRNMALGFLWSLLNPLILTAVLSAVWILRFGAERSFPSFVLVALIPYNFFAYSISSCTSSIRMNASLVKKVSFPRQVLPIAEIVTHLGHFGIQTTLIVAVLLVFPPAATILTLNLLWLPVVLVIQIGLVVGAGLLVSGLSVLYRDFQYIVDSMMTILFWVCPILYAAPAFHGAGGVTDGEGLPAWAGVLYYLNPLAGILEGYRSVLYLGQAPDPATLGMALAVTLLIGALGVRAFWVHEKEFADLI